MFALNEASKDDESDQKKKESIRIAYESKAGRKKIITKLHVLENGQLEEVEVEVFG